MPSSSLRAPSRAPEAGYGAPVVFAIIPVFNRLALTEACLKCLSAQTYPALRVIVVDGGSTDGTAERVRREFPHAELLQEDRELWWGEAMQLGVEYSLAQSRRDDDMLLMMNNDTLIDPDYVTTLVRVSQERHAAVGGVIVDSSDPSNVLDAGEFIDWSTYSFPVKTDREPGETYVDGVDLLSGRGTLVPLAMVRAAGNVNGTRFPHYIADCEFFSRLKRKGFRLGVTWEAVIRSHVEVTGLSTQHADPLTFAQAWQALFSKRSMDNVRNHWRFIEDCAATRLHGPLKRRLMWRCAYLVASRTALRHVALPLAWFLSGLYYVTKEDCLACGCDADLLLKTGVLKPWRHDEWYLLDEGSRSRITEDPKLRRLYGRAWNPLTKMTRWIRAKRRGQASGGRLLL
ncbi:MAG TPA: glycosyltransferase family 2 protein [Nitrospira sp.]|nr:glycosyltransferase family 2 protein [Nitrospira sp.]